MNTPLLRRIWLAIGLGALVGASLLALSSAVWAQTPGQTPQSQGTQGGPTGTSEATPGPNIKTLVKVTVQQTKPIPKGQEFEAQVSIDNVDHLNAFDFFVTFDPARLEPVFAAGSGQPAATAPPGTPTGAGVQRLVKAANLGKFLTSSGRQELQCQAAIRGTNQYGVLCTLLGAPVCLGGQPGVSGSGLLASLFFKSKGGGLTSLKLTETKLTLDDVAPPCPTSATDPFTIQAIPHRSQDTTVLLEKDSGSKMLLIVVAIVVVAVVVVGGGAGYAVYRRRQSGGTG